MHLRILSRVKLSSIGDVVKIFLFLLLLPNLGYAQQMLYARCGEPVCIRYDQVEGKIKQQEDGFAGVSPTFIISKEAPRRLTFLWGPASWARDELQIRERLQYASVLDATAEKITAVRVEPGGVTQMYSLYPTKGLVYFTQHRFIVGQVPTASTFYATCEFLK